MSSERVTAHDSSSDQQEKVQREDAPEAVPAEPTTAEQTASPGDQARPPQNGADVGDPGDAAGETDALRDRYLRLAAEYDNYRKRTERERLDSWARAQAQLVERLLEPLDDLQRVADFDVETTSAGALLEGVQLVERKMLRVLEAAGLEIVDAENQPFDPAIHEALMTAPAEAREDDDTVADVFQKGYRLKGVLLRPARVRVRKYEG